MTGQYITEPLKTGQHNVELLESRHSSFRGHAALRALGSVPHLNVPDTADALSVLQKPLHSLANKNQIKDVNVISERYCSKSELNSLQIPVCVHVCGFASHWSRWWELCGQAEGLGGKTTAREEPLSS